MADDFSKGRRKYLAAFGDKITIREDDFEQCDAMDKALEGAEVVFISPAKSVGVGYSTDNHPAFIQMTAPASIYRSILNSISPWSNGFNLVFNESRG